jgi:ParB-like chromosome segregation protein Spo0J
MGVEINWEHAQSDAIDLTVPVILAWTKAGSLLPIDGWHRIAKATLAGVETLPAVVLNKAESKRCWIR